MIMINNPPLSTLELISIIKSSPFTQLLHQQTGNNSSKVGFKNHKLYKNLEQRRWKPGDLPLLSVQQLERRQQKLPLPPSKTPQKSPKSWPKVHQYLKPTKYPQKAAEYGVEA